MSFIGQKSVASGSRIASAAAVAAAGTATVSFTASAVSATDLTTYTFSSQSLGTEAADRKVVVVAKAGANFADVSTLTVAGSSATLVKNQQTTEESVDIWQVALATGTTGDIVVTWSAATQFCGIGVYAVYGAAAAAHATAGSSSADPATATIDCPAGGVIISGVIHRSTATTFTWTNLTERYDALVENGIAYHSGASDAFATTQTGLALTASSAIAGSRPEVFAAASWGPA